MTNYMRVRGRAQMIPLKKVRLFKLFESHQQLIYSYQIPSVDVLPFKKQALCEYCSLVS